MHDGVNGLTGRHAVPTVDEDPELERDHVMVALLVVLDVEVIQFIWNLVYKG